MRTKTENDPPYAKVLFRVVGAKGEVDVETLWAHELGGDMYRLANIPFYAYSISWEDTVYAPFSNEEQLPTFERVIEKSGNRTIRIVFDQPVQDGNPSDQILQGLVELGCSYEGASPEYVSINVPIDVDLDKVTAYLIASEVNWEHADPTFEELFPNSIS